jgi:hypothetical protein
VILRILEGSNRNHSWEWNNWKLPTKNVEFHSARVQMKWKAAENLPAEKANSSNSEYYLRNI